MPKGIRTTETCQVVENGAVCGLHADHNGMCNKHWTRFTRHGDPTIRKLAWGDAETRFFQKVNRDGPMAKKSIFGRCWVWTGYRNPGGYGRFGSGSKVVLAHRWAYEHWIGPIPVGMPLDHFACDNVACVNPTHLRPTSHRENILRSGGMSSKHAGRTHCNNGHEFTPENTIVRADGYRSCRQCRLESRRTGKRPNAYGRTGPKPRQ